jgi:tetratricopeptide (TPR) repeat protein
MLEWRDDSWWSKRSDEFLLLRELIDGRNPRQPVMEIAVPYGNTDALTSWVKLPSHPNILEAFEWDRRRVVVRYAAIAWDRYSSPARHTVANWGLQLVDAFTFIHKHLPERYLGLVLRPLVKIDVGHHIRLALVHDVYDGTDDELFIRLRAHCDEAGLVHTVGRLLHERCNVDDVDFVSVIERASARAKNRRYQTLADLKRALLPFATKTPIRCDRELMAWQLFEEAVGWLGLGRSQTALERFQAALSYDSTLLIAEEGVELARGQLEAEEDGHPSPRDDISLPEFRVTSPFGPGQPLLVETMPSKTVRARTFRAEQVHISWQQAEHDGMRLETQRDFVRALELYRAVTPGASNVVAWALARARCHHALGEDGEAIDYAQRALAKDTAHGDALWILASAMLRRGWHAEALRNAERLVELEASGRAHYLRGKSLFALGRLPEAHDAFVEAARADPKLLEAQLLRREVDRAMGNVRQSVGTQHAPTFDIPEQLAELRDVLVGGNTEAAIAALRDDRYARDADAQLLLARLLAFDRRHDDAIAVYDGLEATSHRVPALVGKATALLELGRHGDALSIFEQLPDDADAAEGQARALEALGRPDDAAEAYRRFIALAARGSDLRVRAAALALEDIAQRRRT